MFPAKLNEPIWIIEDDHNTASLIATYLEREGYKTRIMHDGGNALTALQGEPVGFVVLDVMLPGIDGFETCRRLKNKSATKDIPVIFMTALAEITDKVKAFEAGGTDYITKPHHYAEVVARVNTHLTLRTLQRQLQK